MLKFHLKLLKLLFPAIYYEYINLKTYSEMNKWAENNKHNLVPTVKYVSVDPAYLLYITRKADGYIIDRDSQEKIQLKRI